MSDTINVVAVRPLSEALKAIALEPPAWTRLEPQSVTGDPAPGLEARVGDPCWLLLRQWQFGEFEGEDAGTPLGVRIDYRSRRLDAWQPGDPGPDAAGLPLAPGDPLEPMVEREPRAAGGPGLRPRAEAGSVLVSALAEAGMDARAALVAAFPLPLDAPPPAGMTLETWQIPRGLRVVALTSPDAEQAAASLEAAGAGGPPWLAGANAEVLAAAQRWLAWYRGQVSPPPDGGNPSWIADRLEYHFSVRAGGDDPLVLRAPLHDGGAIDWYTFDCDQGRRLDTPAPGAGALPPGQANVMATPLRYAGMPADRLWEFEDGAVNLGKLEVQPHDLARLCFTEFAMIYGNDWFVVPLDLPTGSLTSITEVAYTTTFGDRFVVPVADDGARAGRFRMFQVSIAGTDDTLPALLTPTAARGALEGRALEEVLFLRDESANMAWAIEQTVQGGSGEPRSRGDEPQVRPELPPLKAGAEIRYTLETMVPPNWIPLVPVPTTGHGGFILRKGTMTDRDESLGAILDPTPFSLQDEEVPREGVRVRRVPSLLRTADGRTVRWIARRVSIGRGEGSSGLAFDSAAR
jgi:hypothetical protein